MKVKRTEPPSAYEEIMKKADIVDVARRLKMYVSEDDWTVCPFHGDGQEMSLMLNRKTNKFYCPACQKEGDVVDLYREIRKVDSIQAILRLGKAYGVTDPPPQAPEQPPQKQMKMKLFSAKELQNKELKPIEFLVEGILPKGVSMLCAPTKFGKSFMVMQLAVSIASGQPFLGFQTNKAGVLYLSLEDSETRFQQRMNAVLGGEKAPEGFYGSIYADKADGALFSELDSTLQQLPHIGLIIIDTFQKVRGSAKKAESAYSNDYNDVAAFADFAKQRNVGVLLVHHTRKSKDKLDQINNINGSNGIAGGMDTIWALSREGRMDENTRFFISGRDVAQDEHVLYFNQEEGVWSYVGKAAEQAELAPDRLKRRREELYISTIKALVERSESGSWSGTAQEFLDKVMEVTGEDTGESAKQAGIAIKLIENKLYKLNIEHSTKRVRVDRVHVFTKTNNNTKQLGWLEPLEPNNTNNTILQ